MLEIIFWQSLVLFLWFQSSILDTLSKLPYLRVVLDRKDYEKFAQTFNPAHYTLHLSQRKYTKALGCEICVNFWLTVASSLLLGFDLFPVIYVLSFLVYNLLRKTYAHSQP